MREPLRAALAAGAIVAVTGCGVLYSSMTNDGQPGASWFERSERTQLNPEAVATVEPALPPLPKTGKAVVLPQSAIWRCEVDYRCYDTDDDTGERLSLLRSGTAWYEEPSEYPQGSPGDMNAQSTACFEARNHFSGGRTCNTGWPDFYDLELEPEIGCRCERR